MFLFLLLILLDFFVLFSSSAAAWWSPRQADYAAGNAFLYAMAPFRRAAGCTACGEGGTGTRATSAGGAVGSVAGGGCGAGVREGGDAVAVCGVAAGFSVTCRGACLPDLAEVVRPATDRGFAFVDGCLSAGLEQGTASRVCQSNEQ